MYIFFSRQKLTFLAVELAYLTFVDYAFPDHSVVVQPSRLHVFPVVFAATADHGVADHAVADRAVADQSFVVQTSGLHVFPDSFSATADHGVSDRAVADQSFVVHPSRLHVFPDPFPATAVVSFQLFCPPELLLSATAVLRARVHCRLFSARDFSLASLLELAFFVQTQMGK